MQTQTPSSLNGVVSENVQFKILTNSDIADGAVISNIACASTAPDYHNLRHSQYLSASDSAPQKPMAKKRASWLPDARPQEAQHVRRASTNSVPKPYRSRASFVSSIAIVIEGDECLEEKVPAREVAEEPKPIEELVTVEEPEPINELEPERQQPVISEGMDVDAKDYAAVEVELPIEEPYILELNPNWDESECSQVKWYKPWWTKTAQAFYNQSQHSRSDQSPGLVRLSSHSTNQDDLSSSLDVSERSAPASYPYSRNNFPIETGSNSETLKSKSDHPVSSKIWTQGGKPSFESENPSVRVRGESRPSFTYYKEKSTDNEKMSSQSDHVICHTAGARITRMDGTLSEERSKPTQLRTASGSTNRSFTYWTQKSDEIISSRTNASNSPKVTSKSAHAVLNTSSSDNDERQGIHKSSSANNLAKTTYKKTAQFQKARYDDTDEYSESFANDDGVVREVLAADLSSGSRALKLMTKTKEAAHSLGCISGRWNEIVSQPGGFSSIREETAEDNLSSKASNPSFITEGNCGAKSENEDRTGRAAISPVCDNPLGVAESKVGASAISRKSKSPPPDYARRPGLHRGNSFAEEEPDTLSENDDMTNSCDSRRETKKSKAIAPPPEYARRPGLQRGNSFDGDLANNDPRRATKKSNAIAPTPT
jgi:hypothetical protein